MAQIYISLGSNIERESNIKHGLTALEALLGKLEVSSVFESQALGFIGNPFFNLVVGATTEMPLTALSDALRQIEYQFGREHNAKKFAPRTLDLDLLLFDDLICDEPVQLPRAEITQNAFVLWPLAEIAPNAKHPVLKQSFASLWHAFDKTSQQLTPVPFSWQSTLRR